MITFIGGAAWDVTLRVRQIPAAGDEVGGRVLYENPGGKATNSAARAACAGAQVRLIASVGDDGAGRRVRDRCEQIDGLHVHFTPSRATRTAMVLVDPSGERTIVHFMPGGAPANAPDPAHVTDDLLAGAEWTWIDEHDPDRRAAFRRRVSGKAGLPVQHLAEEARHGRHWNFAVGSVDDVDHVDERDIARAGLGFCVLTRGADGSTVWQREAGWSPFAAERVPAHEVVDTCGAGDAFLGGLLAGLDRFHGDLHAAMKLAALTGADAVRLPGSWPQLRN